MTAKPLELKTAKRKEGAKAKKKELEKATRVDKLSPPSGFGSARSLSFAHLSHSGTDLSLLLVGHVDPSWFNFGERWRAGAETTKRRRER